MKLNEAQQQAVRHIKGPMMVLAGPGSGKTRVITERVKYLIKNKIKPEKILVITFTKAAADEMQERFISSAEGNYSQQYKVRFGTFHSVFFSILKVHYGYKAENILKENVHYAILRDIVANVDMEIRDEKDFINDISSQISAIKGSLINIDNYYSPSCPNEIFKEIYAKYNDTLIRQNLLDFDDMLSMTYELLRDRKDIRKLWQEKYEYILIDEFQDVNFIQYETMKLLAGPKKNIFIVGDDDQSIYGFRGANPDIMNRFLKDFKGAEEILLNVNYRSSSNIIKGAGLVISNNEHRMAKEILSNAEYTGMQESEEDNPTIDIREFEELKQENDYICKLISAYHESGINYSDISVLFRTNLQGRALMSKLKVLNIPFFMKDIIPNIYEHWIVQDILSYIKVALGDRDRSLYLRIINRPKRYVSRQVFKSANVDINSIYDEYKGKEWMLERLDKFCSDMKYLAKMRPYAGVNFIRNGIGYDDYIKEYADYRGVKPDEMYDLLDKLLEEAKEHKTYEEWFEYIEKYSEELREQRSKQIKSKDDEERDEVILQTMHSSKGLEYKYVIVPDVNEGVSPHKKAVLQRDLEEERRLFYVAMTRAKTGLHIFFLKERHGKKMEMSRFVPEIMQKGG